VLFKRQNMKLNYSKYLHTYFQYSPEFLKEENYRNLFPYIIRKTPLSRVFSNYAGGTFRGLPPVFADSLPDLFGNLVFREWMAHTGTGEITPLQQLAYVGKRGMGALEYQPAHPLPGSHSLKLGEMADLAKRIVQMKSLVSGEGLNHESLVNMFKLGTSAGGARPKILVSENRSTGELVPGDVNVPDGYAHYLVKLAVDDETYPRERIEFAYYRLARDLGIEMQPSKLVSGRHFCTERFDRQDGRKRHVLTACGMTGWDYRSGRHSAYENLFRLCNGLGVPHPEVEELYRRMVFNVVYLNVDDHLKNTSFMYDDEAREWHLAPAYDLTYALNPLHDFTKVNRALSIGGKRNCITRGDLMAVARTFGVRNAANVIDRTASQKTRLIDMLEAADVPERIVRSMDAKLSANISEAMGVKNEKHRGHSV